jgi:hypothetical protein
MTESKRCDCFMCRRHAELLAVIGRGNIDEMAKFIVQQETSILNLELDRDVANCVLDGSWPSAREQLERALAKCPPATEEQP